MSPLLLASAALANLPGPPARGTGSIALEVSGLRSSEGVVQACLTADRRHFPDCAADPAAHRLTVPAAAPFELHFTGLAPGTYAIALFHDANGNGRLDTRFGIPVEGFGFSNNPRLRFGPPGFDAARIVVRDGASSATVNLRYLF